MCQRLIRLTELWLQTLVFQGYLWGRWGQTNAGARETVQLNKMFSRHSGKPDASFKSQWIRPTLNLCRPWQGRTLTEGCVCLLSESLLFSVCCNVAMNLYSVSLLVWLRCKIGKRKFSIAPVTLNCSDHLALSVLANLPGVLRGLGAPTHIQITKTSAVLWSNCWWWHILWQEIIAKCRVLRIKNFCPAQKNKFNWYVLNIDSFRFCSGTKIKTTFQDLLSNH